MATNARASAATDKSLQAINGENRPVVIYTQTNRSRFELGLAIMLEGIYATYLELMKQKPKDVNMQPVGS